MKKNNWLLTLLVSGITINILNNRIFSVSKSKIKKSDTERKTYNWKFGSVSYRKLGKGTPVLLVHDTFSGASSIEFDRIFHQLSKKHKVFAIDLLGFGFSERNNITYTAYLYMQLINDFIQDIMKKEDVAVITSGSSNIFALLASQQNPHLIRKCIMINPVDLRVASLNPTHRDNMMKYLLELPYIGTTIYNLIHCKLNYNHLFSDLTNRKSLRYYTDQFYHSAHFDNSNVRYTFASSIANYMNLDIRDTLSQSNISLYMISGKNRTTDFQLIEDQYSSFNSSIECTAIKKASNLPHLENPFSTYDYIQLYLQD